MDKEKTIPFKFKNQREENDFLHVDDVFCPPSFNKKNGSLVQPIGSPPMYNNFEDTNVSGNNTRTLFPNAQDHSRNWNDKDYVYSEFEEERNLQRSKPISIGKNKSGKEETEIRHDPSTKKYGTHSRGSSSGDSVSPFSHDLKSEENSPSSFEDIFERLKASTSYGFDGQSQSLPLNYQKKENFQGIYDNIQKRQKEKRKSKFFDVDEEISFEENPSTSTYEIAKEYNFGASQEDQNSKNQTVKGIDIPIISFDNNLAQEETKEKDVLDLVSERITHFDSFDDFVDFSNISAPKTDRTHNRTGQLMPEAPKKELLQTIVTQKKKKSKKKSKKKRKSGKNGNIKQNVWEKSPKKIIRNSLPNDFDGNLIFEKETKIKGKGKANETPIIKTQPLNFFENLQLQRRHANSTVGYFTFKSYNSKSQFSGGYKSNYIGKQKGTGGHTFANETKASRTLFVRNISSYVNDQELESTFKKFGKIKSIYTQCKHRGFVMISYFDLRDSMKAKSKLQGKIIQNRKIDIHFSLPKENPSEKDMNQGIINVFGLNHMKKETFKEIFVKFGEIKAISEYPKDARSYVGGKMFKTVEYYDLRSAEQAKFEINEKIIDEHKVKVEYFQDPRLLLQMQNGNPHLRWNMNKSNLAVGRSKMNQFQPQAIQRVPMMPSQNIQSGINNYGYSGYQYHQQRRKKVSSQEDQKKFELNIKKVKAGKDQRTTLMIRNIPNKYSKKMLIETIDKSFKNKYDFIYLPIDFFNKYNQQYSNWQHKDPRFPKDFNAGNETSSGGGSVGKRDAKNCPNKGFAFINFKSYKTIPKFYLEFQGKKWKKFNSEKICNITYARVQGLNNLVNHFERSRIGQLSNTELKPFFKDNNKK